MRRTIAHKRFPDLAASLFLMFSLAVMPAALALETESETQQTNNPTDENDVEDEVILEEIVVTAQRREQSLQDVPVSVTVFTGDDLERSNINEGSTLLSLTPNVAFSEDGQTGSRGISISIRGVNDIKSGENSVINSIGAYLDDFSVASVANGTINPQLQDLERVEVLRGPQGTYFGRNSVGGALNLTTRKPTDSLGGRLNFGGGRHDDAGEVFHLGGTFNVPVTDTFWLRGLTYLETDSGLVENINPTGAPDSGHDHLSARLSGRWQQSDSTLVDAMVMHSDESQGTDATVPSGVWDIDTVDTFGLGVAPSLTQAPDPGTGFFPSNRNRLSHDLDERNDNASTIGIAKLQKQIGARSNLLLVGGVIDSSSDRLFDNDLIGGADLVQRTNAYEGTSSSLEARYERASERFDWVLGALYARDEQQQETRIRVGESAATPINGVSLLPPAFVFPVGLCLQCNDKEFEVSSSALFGDVTWHASGRLDVTLGARATRDDVTTTVNSTTSLQPGLPFSNVFREDASNQVTFDDLSPRLGAHYQLNDDVRVYGLISKGYKGGGTSIGHDTNAPGQPAIIAPFDEEELWNAEVGFKSEWLGRRLRVNAAAFRLDWSDLQLESFRFLTSGDLSSNFEQTINIDSARAQGVEVDWTARVTNRLSLSGGLGYLDAVIDCACVAELTGGFVVDLDGAEVPRSPELTGHLVGEYRWTMGSTAAFVAAELLHRDGQFADIEATTWRQTRGRFTPNSGGTAFVPAVGDDGFPFRTPDYDVVNLRGGFFRGQWEVAVYVENLLDEDYYTGTQENFGLTGIRLRPHPRKLGTNVSFHF